MDRRVFLYGAGASLMAGFTPWQAGASGGRQPIGYIRTNWSRDPFSYGSYSYIAKGSGRRHIRALDEPVGGRVCFAGEAAYPDYNSTVHAAYESGQRAAGFVLEGDVQNIAIVGAGMSGLSAAHRLSGQGLNVTVLEARDRIGGRVWTDNRLGMPLDLGASWIHGVDGNPLSALADAQEMARVVTDDEGIVRGRDGRELIGREVPGWLGNVTEVQNSAGADSSQINMLGYAFVDDYDGDEVIFPGGYRDIFRNLEGDYALKLATPVKGIGYGDDVVIELLDGETARFDAVIVTVPLGVLKKGGIAFDPPLPEKKQRAIDRLGMGTLDKLYLQYEDVFWDKDVTWIVTPENDLPQGQFNLWLNFHKYFGIPVIMAFNGGPPALNLSGLSDNEMISRALQTLTGAYPV